MYNPDTELLFPPGILPALQNLRGTPWQDLVTSVMAAGGDTPVQVAFVLMMARMNNCITCNSNSYRAMNGCLLCTKQSLKRFREADKALIEIFHAARAEVEQYMQKKAFRYQDDGLDHHQIVNR
jgi:hypothetical protein